MEVARLKYLFLEAEKQIILLQLFQFQPLHPMVVL